MPDQRPLGPKALNCPLWRKSMASVCHRCGWWTKLELRNPQTGERVDRWDCAIAAAVMLSAEIGLRTNQVAATIEDARNHVVEAADGVAGALHRASHPASNTASHPASHAASLAAAHEPELIG
jgi:hypothetical protein